MFITLSDGTVIEVKKVDPVAGQIDYRRTTGAYTGDCVLYSTAESEADIKVALELELVQP